MTVGIWEGSSFYNHKMADEQIFVAMATAAAFFCQAEFGLKGSSWLLLY